MKKFFAICVIFTVLVFVVSCGGKKKTTDEGDTGETVTDEDVADTEPAGDTEPEGDTEPTGDTEPADDADTTPEPDDDGDSADDSETTAEKYERLQKECKARGGRWYQEESGYWECLRYVPCKEKPENTIWWDQHDDEDAYPFAKHGFIVQTWNETESAWEPDPEDVPTIFAAGDELASSMLFGDCHYQCADGYIWNFGDESKPVCYNPCDGVEHSTGNPISATNSRWSGECECEAGYFWSPSGMNCKNPCEEAQSTKCAGFECEAKSSSSYDCKCGENYASLTLSDGSVYRCEQLFVDPDTKLVWSRNSNGHVLYSEAEEYCETLSQGGSDDWHLPTINEARTLVQNCDNLAIGGYCKVTDYLWSANMSTFQNPVCRCEVGTAPDLSFKLGDYGTIHTSTPTKNENSFLVLQWYESQTGPYASLLEYSTASNGQNVMRCVKRPWSEPYCSEGKGFPCVDYTTQKGNLMWSSAQTATNYHQGAQTTCNNLEEGGFTDWRLPTISELRTLLQNCPETDYDLTTSTEVCMITDECNNMDEECGWSNCRNGCSTTSGLKYSKLGDPGSFWSSTPASYDSRTFIIVNFTKGSLAFVNTGYDNYNYRCVRNAAN